MTGLHRVYRFRSASAANQPLWRSVPAPVLGRVAFVSHLRQRHVADGDAEHYPPGVWVGQLLSQRTGFLRTRTPLARVVDTLSHCRLRTYMQSTHVAHTDSALVAPRCGVVSTKLTQLKKPG